ncbi:MAG: RNA degradosome polyphosphate kinase, partial [Cyanobacteria bacterium J06607_6]
MLSSSEFTLNSHPPRLLDRELSWIAFNRRLIYDLADTAQPPLSRLLRLAQAAAALDEYFMVRVPLLKTAHGPVAIADHPDSLQHIRPYLR